MRLESGLLATRVPVTINIISFGIKLNVGIDELFRKIEIDGKIIIVLYLLYF